MNSSLVSMKSALVGLVRVFFKRYANCVPPQCLLITGGRMDIFTVRLQNQRLVDFVSDLI